MKNAKENSYSFFYKNSLTIVFLLFFIVTILLQAFTGLSEYNSEMQEEGGSQVNFLEYLATGHFIQATFENWESEFFQMALFVILTIGLRQKGSSESKPMEGDPEIDSKPKPSPDAPWPVNKGGWMLKVYENSLSITLFLLFVLSFILHWYGSLKNYNTTQILRGAEASGAFEYLGKSKLWFETFQNWQSEFLSIVAIVYLSIYLRQRGSAQSKAVDAPHSETE